MIGTCPKCGAPVFEGESKYFCRSNDCDFQFDKNILKQSINQVQASKLLSHRRTDILDGFISKSGKPFPAFLVMDSVGKITFEFPSQESDSDSKNKTEPSGEMVECKALLNAATKNIFQSNAFRITGLTVDATGREIVKHVDKLKIMAELGQAHPGDNSVFALKPSPTLDHIREAIQKLKEPELRVIDEFFWFWPEEFGSGENDPALKAIARGELQTALDIWTQKERDNSDGVMARHNLWVYSQMLAVENEADLDKKHSVSHSYRMNPPPPAWRFGSADLEKATDEHWQKASIHFNAIAKDSKHWDKLKKRIRALDDARLGVDFASQIKTALPKALARISAELALIHAEKGNSKRASIQVRLARETAGKDEADQILQALLVSSKNRVQELAKKAKEDSKRDPDNASKVVFSLIEIAKPILETFNLLLGIDNYIRNDLFDEVANACTNCAVDYQKKTGDNQMFLALLESILPYAASAETRQRVNKNIAIAKSNLADKQLKPVFENLDRITKGDSASRIKLTKINEEVVSKLGYYSTVALLPAEAINDLSDSIAAALRTISIDLHNNHNDTENALVAIEQAVMLAKDQELLKRVNNDRIELRKMKLEQDSHNLHLNVRDDNIRVSQAGIQYNDKYISSIDVTGIRFGIGNMAVISEVELYTVGIRSQQGSEIHIDFKKFFRSREQSRKDLNDTLSALFYHVIPGLSDRIAKNIKAGQELQLGDCWLTKSGIRGSVGALLWKGEVTLPWAEVRYGIANGYLALRSTKNPKFHKTFELRTTWNAGIFKEIIDKV